MKKVLFVAPSLTLGGMERALVTLANALQRTGYAVTVLLLDPQNVLEGELDRHICVIHKPYKSHFGQKIPYIRNKFYDDGMWETRAKARQLYDYYVGGETYDAEIAFFRGLSVKIVSGSTNKNAVRLAWVHNDFRQARGTQNNFNSAEEVFRAYASFDRVICVSKQARVGFLEAVGDTGNTQTVYNLIPAAQIRERAQEKPAVAVKKAGLHLVIAGRLEDRIKGQLRLVRAVMRLKSEGDDVSLAIVGGGSDEEMLRQEIKDARAEDYVFLTGSQANPYPFIAQADWLVCASYYEGYNLTVAEALILGVPVLSTRCTGPCEILDNGKYGMLVENSGEGLYEGLKTLCGNPALTAEYRRKAALRQDFFDEKTILKQITDLL